MHLKVLDHATCARAVTYLLGSLAPKLVKIFIPFLERPPMYANKMRQTANRIAGWPLYTRPVAIQINSAVYCQPRRGCVSIVSTSGLNLCYVYL